jgi:hypothetical protein
MLRPLPTNMDEAEPDRRLMAPGQSYWRYHNKPRSIPARRVIVHVPDPGTVAHIRQLMKMATETARASGLPRPLFPFEASDVVEIHSQRQGETGLWSAFMTGACSTAPASRIQRTRTIINYETLVSIYTYQNSQFTCLYDSRRYIYLLL